MGRFLITTCTTLAVLAVWVLLAFVAAADFIGPGM
jgi:hypothetical protein